MAKVIVVFNALSVITLLPWDMDSQTVIRDHSQTSAVVPDYWGSGFVAFTCGSTILQYYSEDEGVPICLRYSVN